MLDLVFTTEDRCEHVNDYVDAHSTFATANHKQLINRTFQLLDQGTATLSMQDKKAALSELSFSGRK